MGFWPGDVGLVCPDDVAPEELSDAAPEELSDAEPEELSGGDDELSDAAPAEATVGSEASDGDSTVGEPSAFVTEAAAPAPESAPPSVDGAVAPSLLVGALPVVPWTGMTGMPLFAAKPIRGWVAGDPSSKTTKVDLMNTSPRMELGP